MCGRKTTLFFPPAPRARFVAFRTHDAPRLASPTPPTDANNLTHEARWEGGCHLSFCFGRVGGAAALWLRPAPPPHPPHSHPLLTAAVCAIPPVDKIGPGWRRPGNTPRLRKSFPLTWRNIDSGHLLRRFCVHTRILALLIL